MKQISLLDAIQEISQERELDKDIIVAAIEESMVLAARKKYPQYSNIESGLDSVTGEIKLSHYKTIVNEVQDDYNEMSLTSVLEIDEEAEIGDEVEFEIENKEFKNVLAQTVRQTLFQKIREIEQQFIIERYSNKKMQIIHGTVGRIERHRVTVVMNHNAEGVLDFKEQIPNEKLEPGEHIRAFLLEISTNRKTPQLIISRSHPVFLKRLFESEIPEIEDGIVEIKDVAREPGKRAKISVISHDSDIDPVGTCVGPAGSRIQPIISELNGERIDVIEWSPEITEYISVALSPAKIMSITLNDELKNADVEVLPEDLSVAIGKQGQNVKLASTLTKYSINVMPYQAGESTD